MAVASKALVIIRKEGSTLREVTRFRDGLWQRHYPNAHLKSQTIQERNSGGVRLRFWAGCSTIIVRNILTFFGHDWCDQPMDSFDVNGGG